MSFKMLVAPIVAVSFALGGNLFAGPDLGSFGALKSASMASSPAAAMVAIAEVSEHLPHTSLHYGGSWWHHVPSTIHHSTSQVPARDKATAQPLE